MPTAQPELKPNRRGRWLAVAVVVALLAVTTWDVLRNSDRSSPAALRRAAFDGHEATVRRLIAAHPEWIDSVGSTNGQTSVLGSFYNKALKALGKSPEPSLREVQEGEFQRLEGLGATPILHAVVRHRVGAARLLSDAGANVQVELTNGWPFVSYATMMGDTNFLMSLEARGVKLDGREPRSGMSPLHYAVSSQRQGMVQLFIQRGHSVNATNYGGVTPLHFAVDRARLDLVQMLATNGADLTITNSLGRTALDAARYRVSMISTSNANAVITWLEAFAATNQPLAKPAP